MGMRKHAAIVFMPEFPTPKSALFSKITTSHVAQSEHTRKISDSRAPSQAQHRRHDNVRGEPEKHERQVSSFAPSNGDDFEPCVRVGGIQLQLGAEHCEEEDLNGGTGAVPVGAYEAINEGKDGRDDLKAVGD